MEENKNKELIDETEVDVQDQQGTESESDGHEEKVESNEVEDQDFEADLEEMRGKYLRSVAEFDNYRKRTNRERIELISTAGEKTILKLLPILDDFDRAKAAAEDENTEEVFTDGVELVYNKLNKTLQDMGLKAMNSSGETFDPELHEAITEIEAGAEQKGKIVDTIERGYLLNEKIIRYAKVVVGK